MSAPVYYEALPPGASDTQSPNPNFDYQLSESIFRAQVQLRNLDLSMPDFPVRGMSIACRLGAETLAAFIDADCQFPVNTDSLPEMAFGRRNAVAQAATDILTFLNGNFPEDYSAVEQEDPVDRLIQDERTAQIATGLGQTLLAT